MLDKLIALIVLVTVTGCTAEVTDVAAPAPDAGAPDTGCIAEHFVGNAAWVGDASSGTLYCELPDGSWTATPQ